MKRFLIALLFLCFASPALAADTPNPVTPGYQICSTASGSTICGFQAVDSTHPLPVVQGGGAQITGNATGSTGAVVGTLAAASGKTTYICGFSVSAIGGTAAVGPITIAGTVTSSMIWHLASSASGNSITVPFSPCIKASGTNTAITITTTADGTATAVDVNSWGYQQ